MADQSIKTCFLCGKKLSDSDKVVLVRRMSPRRDMEGAVIMECEEHKLPELKKTNGEGKRGKESKKWLWLVDMRIRALPARAREWDGPQKERGKGRESYGVQQRRQSALGRKTTEGD